MRQGKLRDVFAPPRKTDFFFMRVRPEDKRTIRLAAQRVGLSMAAYLTELHHFAIGKRDGRSVTHSAG